MNAVFTNKIRFYNPSQDFVHWHKGGSLQNVCKNEGNVFNSFTFRSVNEN